MDGSHHRLCFFFGECPDVCGMSPGNHERVAAGCVSLVEEGDRLLILIHRQDGNEPWMILQKGQSTAREYRSRA